MNFINKYANLRLFNIIQRFELAEKFVLLLATTNQIEGNGDVIVNIECILELKDFNSEDPLFSYEDKSLLRWYFTLPNKC